MYVVIKGQVQLYRDAPSGRVVLSKAGAGHFFGEMSLIGSTPRTATAMVLVDTVLAGYSNEELESLLGTKPEVGARMIRDLVARLKETTDKLTEERNKKAGFVVI